MSSTIYASATRYCSMNKLAAKCLAQLPFSCNVFHREKQIHTTHTASKMSSDLGFHAHPGSAAVIARCANILLLLLLCIWVFAYLGGLGFTPTAHEDGSNDTSTYVC